jgi:hypothetical protein
MLREGHGHLASEEDKDAVGEQERRHLRGRRGIGITGAIVNVTGGMSHSRVWLI